MENLAPSLRFILSVRYSLESGRSLNLAVKDYLRTARDEFSDFLLKWMSNYEVGKLIDPTEFLKSPAQIVLVHLIHRGLSGQAIHSPLLELEKEVVETCRLELTKSADRLSFRLLIPLLLFQFPALLILFLGFLSDQITKGFQ